MSYQYNPTDKRYFQYTGSGLTASVLQAVAETEQRKLAQHMVCIIHADFMTAMESLYIGRAAWSKVYPKSLPIDQMIFQEELRKVFPDARILIDINGRYLYILIDIWHPVTAQAPKEPLPTTDLSHVA